MRPICVLATILLASCGGLAFAQNGDLQPYVAEYEIRASVLRGKLRTEVVTTDTGMLASSAIRAEHGIGKFAREEITERAEFRIDNGRIVPIHYSSSDPLSNHPKELNFVFDHDAGTVSGTVNDTEYVHDLGDNLFDRVTIQYQLMLDLHGGEPRPLYQLMNGKRIKDMPIERIPGKSVETPAGTFDTVGIENVHARKERRTVLWCAEELDYLPVVIEQYRKGKLQARAVLQSYARN